MNNEAEGLTRISSPSCVCGHLKKIKSSFASFFHLLYKCDVTATYSAYECLVVGTETCL